MEITYDTVRGGYAAFHGEKKVAIITTRHDQGMALKGVPQLEPMPRESWTIHFTSPSMHLDLVEAVMKSLPTEP